MTPQLIASLDRHATERPSGIAVRTVSERGELFEIGWRALRDAASRRAAELRGDAGPVMLRRECGWELLVDMLGALWAERDAMPVPAALPASEVAVLRERLARAVPREGGALLLQSSGTTGRPKIVRRTHAALRAVGVACARDIGVGPDDTLLLPIPLHHSYGIDMALLTGIEAGCCVEIHDRFQVPLALAAVRSREITVLPAVPLIFDGLARVARAASARPHRIRRAISAGSPLPRRVYDAFLATFGVPIGQLYGATEFGSLTWNDPAQPGFDPMGVGRPMGAAEVRVVSVEASSADAPVPAGCDGQLAVRSDGLLSEYVDDSEPSTHSGFFFPRDLGHVTHDGCVVLTGRIKLLIDIGSVKVNPFEIEAVLSQHPDVREVVVVGLAASDTVARLKAFVVPEPGARPTAESLRAFARERLIHYKIPRSFEITDDVPRSPTGKILRQALPGRRADRAADGA